MLRVADTPGRKRHPPSKVKQRNVETVKQHEEIVRQIGILKNELEGIKQHVASLERLVLDIGEAARDAIEEPSDEPEV